MRTSALLGFSLLSLVLPFAAGHDVHGRGRRHDGVARRARNDVTVHNKRSFANARLTFYDVGLGACGKTNVPSDFIVALNTPQFTQGGGGYPSAQCFKSITIQVGNKQTGAVIMDECPGCPYGGLDLSRGLFDFFASESVGVLSATWWFDDQAPAAPAPTTTTPPPPPPPTTTHHSTTPPPPPPPTSTPEWTPSPSPTPTTHSSSSVWTPSSSSTHTSSSHTPSSSATPTPTPSSSSAAPTPTPHGIEDLNQVVLGMAGLVLAGGN